MNSIGIPFPNLGPEMFSIAIGRFEFALRWYALAYIVGILIGWWLCVRALKRASLWPQNQPPMAPQTLADLVTWLILGIIIGGRLGFVLFYQPGYYLANPLDILKVWQGGMSFHGGFLGVAITATIFCVRNRIPLLTSADMLGWSHRSVCPRADREFHQCRALGAADGYALGGDLSRCGGAGLCGRGGRVRAPPLAALRGGA